MALDTATIRIAAKVAGEDAVKSLAKQLEITDREARGLIKTNLALGSSSAQAAAGVTAAGTASGAAAKGFAALRATAATLAATLGPLAAFVGLGSLATLGTQAETAEAKLRTLKNAIPDFEKLGPLLQQVAKETGGIVGPAELSAGAYEVLSSGATSAADAAAKLKAALVLAQGGAVETSVAVDGLTSVINAYQVETSRATEVADKIRKTVDDGKISFEEYSTQIGKAAAVAAGAGVSLDELNAAIGVVTSGGIRAESAISGVRQLIVNIIKPTEDAQKVAKQYGIELSAQALQSKGLIGVLEDIRKKTGGNSQAVSKLITDVDSLTAAQALFVKDGEKFKELLDNQSTSAGTAAKAANELAGTTESSTKRIAAAYEQLSLTVVEVFTPTFAWVAEKLAGLINLTNDTLGAIRNLVSQVQQLPGIGGLFSGQNAQVGLQAAASLVPGVNVFSAIFNMGPRRSGGTQGSPPRTPRVTPPQTRYNPLAGRQTAGGTGAAAAGSGSASGSKSKARTPEEIQQSLKGLQWDQLLLKLQSDRESIDQFGRAQIDYAIAEGQAKRAYIEFSQRQGVTASELKAAAALRDQKIKEAREALDRSKAEIDREASKLGTDFNEITSAFRADINPQRLAPKEDNFGARVDEAVAFLTEKTDSTIASLEELLQRLEQTGGPIAEKLKLKVADALTNFKALRADPNQLRAFGTDQVRLADNATIATDQRRELQGLQDQLQALLSPYGELTAVQSLELRLKRENIALSPEERAQRLADAAAIDKTREAVRALNEQQQLSRNLAEGIADAFREGFRGLLFQAQSLEDALSNIFGRLADQLFNIAFNLGVFGNPFGFNGTVFGQVLPGFQPRAAGGPVTAGSPYLVGERGPELFVPRSSGTIVPNGGMGSTSVVVNVDARGTSVQGDNTQGQQLGRVITAAVQAELLRQKRPGGILARGGV